MASENEQRPILTVDVVCFALIDGHLHVLLIRRDDPREPFCGSLSLPGGYVRADGDADTKEAARRVMRTKVGLCVGISVSYMEQLYTFSGPARDPRGWSASVAYMAVAKPSKVRKMHSFYSIEDAIAGTLAFDHNSILAMAVRRIRNKTSYSSLPLFLMPPRFSLSELQQVYEGLIGVQIDRSTFRRRIVEQGIIEPTGQYQTETSHRPAELYQAVSRNLYVYEGSMVT